MSFYVKLKKFFHQHDPERLYMIKKIVRNFAANEDDVMARLEDIYATGGPSKLRSTTKPTTNNFENFSSSSSNEGQESADNVNESTHSVPEKKSKKKLIIITIAAIAILVGGYFGYSMFFTGSSDDTHNAEEAEHDIHATDSHIEKAAHLEETTLSNEEIILPEEDNILVDSVETIDSNNVEANLDTLNSNEEDLIIESLEILNALGK